jgi:hypothetical protein
MGDEGEDQGETRKQKIDELAYKVIYVKAELGARQANISAMYI